MHQDTPQENLSNTKQRRFRPSKLVAIVVALLALTVAISSTATAAFMVGSNQIKNNAVKAKHIKKSAVKPRHIKKNAVRPRHIKKNAIKPGHLSPGALADLKGEKGEQGEKGDRGPTGFGLRGPQGEKGEKGDPGLSNRTLEKHRFTIAAGDTEVVAATCPVGSVALGGGFWAQNFDLDVISNQPSTSSPRRWNVAAKNTGSTNAILEAHAVCAEIG